jgi:hypothetical protein
VQIHCTVIPFSKPKGKVNDIVGYQLWRSFQSVVVLDESVRFQADPEWGAGCRQARLGNWTSDFVSIVNSRLMTGPLWSCGSNSTLPSTFVTPDNSTRLSINNLFISTTAQFLSPGEYPLRVVANFKGKLAALTRAERRMVLSLPDSKFGRMAPYLDLIKGMPIQVTQNVRTAKLVANGTLGTLEEIIYEPGTSFRVIRDTNAGILVRIPSVPPAAVIVRIQRGDCAVPMQGCTETSLFPLFF